MARKKKTPEEKADEQRRYHLAETATTDAELEPLLTDPNQGIRGVAAANRWISPALLSRFARDPFWGTRMNVANHPTTTRDTLLSMLEPDPRKRGIVHHEVRQRLESEGLPFGEDGMPR